MKRENGLPERRSPDRIRADLERARAELATSVQALRTQVSRSVDWRHYYRAHTAVFLIAAVTVGFVIGSRGRR